VDEDRTLDLPRLLEDVEHRTDGVSVDRAEVAEAELLEERARREDLAHPAQGPDPFGETSVAALQALCDCVARAYERVILSRKAEDG